MCTIDQGPGDILLANYPMAACLKLPTMVQLKHALMLEVKPSRKHIFDWGDACRR